MNRRAYLSLSHHPTPPHPTLGTYTVDLIQCNIIQLPIASEGNS